MQMENTQFFANVQEVVIGLLRAALVGFDRTPHGGPVDGRDGPLRCIKHVQAQIGRQGMAHGEPANAVALLIESG